MSLWTDEKVEHLKRLWLEGISASQIALTLGEGFTKNAVIGKIHRSKINGAERPKSERAPRAKRQPKPRLAGSKRTRVKNAARAVDALVAGGLPNVVEIPFELPQTQFLGSMALMGMQPDTCKWPVGDPLLADFRFCNATKLDGLPYCEHHHRTAYRRAG